jgi:DNA-binding GntR family transcriptional regulator
MIKSYSVQISDYIKQALLKGELKPGDRINEVRLASALAISRAPVREALQMLVSDGLIVSLPQRGKFIRALSRREIRDSYAMGGVLEGAAVSGCREVFTDDDFAALEEMLARMEALHEDDPEYAEQFAGLDVAFHNTMLAKAGNRLMVECARNACQRVSKFLLFRYWPKAFTHPQVVERHGKVLDAVRTQSRARIEKTIRAHYEELGERMAAFGRDDDDGGRSARPFSLRIGIGDKR